MSFFFAIYLFKKKKTIISHNLDSADYIAVVRLHIHCNLLSPILSSLVQNKAQKAVPNRIAFTKEKKKNKKQSGCLWKRADADKPRILQVEPATPTRKPNLFISLEFAFDIESQVSIRDVPEPATAGRGILGRGGVQAAKSGGCLRSEDGEVPTCCRFILRDMDPGGPRRLGEGCSRVGLSMLISFQSATTKNWHVRVWRGRAEAGLLFSRTQVGP